MSPLWFTKKPNEERRGPYSDEELKRQALSGELSRTDLVWCEGLEMAISAARIPGLFPPPPPMSPRQAQGPLPREMSRNAETEVSENEEEDVFSWYRPGDPRAPSLVNWIGFWQAVHSIGSRNKKLYYLMPFAATLPLGLLLGAVASFVPLVVINYFIIVGVAIVFGESVYQCLRLKNGGRLLEGAQVNRAMAFGFAAALAFAYFYTVGGFFTDMNRAGHGGDLSLPGYFMPWNVAKYLYLKTQCMVVAKFTEVNRANPSLFLNYLTMGVEYFLLIFTAGAVSGGAKNDLQPEPADD